MVLLVWRLWHLLCQTLWKTPKLTRPAMFENFSWLCHHSSVWLVYHLKCMSVTWAFVVVDGILEMYRLASRKQSSQMCLLNWNLFFHRLSGLEFIPSNIFFLSCLKCGRQLCFQFITRSLVCLLFSIHHIFYFPSFSFRSFLNLRCYHLVMVTSVTDPLLPVLPNEVVRSMFGWFGCIVIGSIFVP